MTVYELWDVESANLMGAYSTESEALADLRAIIDTYGRPWVREWELVRTSDAEPAEPILAGEALIAHALDAVTRHTA
jgi:hypothetical protein